MPLQWCNQIWQSLEEGAGKQCSECVLCCANTIWQDYILNETVNCFGRTMLYMCIGYHIWVNMYHVSAQGSDERIVNVHYYYYC